MDPISFAASIVAIIQLTGTVVGYLNDVKDAPKDRARCATEASNLFNLLNNLKYRLEEADTNQPWYTAVRALAVEDGPFDQYKSMLEQLRPKVNSGSRIRKVGNTLLWNFSKQEVNVVLSRMERLKSLILIALEMDHFKLSRAIKASIDNLHNNNQAIKEDTSVIRQAIPTLEKGAHAIQQEQKRQRHRIIADWISPVDFAAQQSDVISRRQEGTGLWFLNSPEFLKWLHNSNQTLFCPGIPGSGKTMITAITVDHLWKYMQNTDIGVAYVYYNYKTQADQTTANLAATILKQLIHGQPSAAEPVVILYERHADQRTRPSLEEIRSALRAVMSNYSKAYIVIDALDECLDHDGSRSQFLALLRDLQSRGDLNLMVTSRFIPQVLQTFRSSPMLEVRASESDVKTFVAGQIYRLPRCVQRDDELQKAIQDGISTAVDGMFLLARLHIDSLLDKSTKKKILSTLDGLPKGSKALDEAYNDAIERIESQLPGNSALARSVLSWITYAQRPLTTGELSHALALDIGDSELDPDNIPDVEDMVSVCVGLVTVDDESEVIRLVHYTTQEYFERIRETWNTNAQKEIASTCLNYLSLSPFMNGSAASDEDWERRLTQNVFFDYASQNWAYHTFPVQEEVMKIALSFLQNGNLIDSASQPACRSNYRYSGYSQNFTKGVTGLHLAARCELLSLLQDMLRIVNENVLIDADCADSDRRTPLSWAAEMGHKAVVKLLVERDDVDVNSKDSDGRTPLWWAAAKGHEDVVKLLVERANVEADLKDYDGRTPLSEAAAQGHDDVVKLLVKRDDVEADSKGWHGQTPLSRAAGKGHEAAVKLLVKRDDVEADLKDLQGRTPLLRAAENGHEAVVKLLLERGDVEADSKDNDRRTPLFEAAENGHEAVVKLLLKQDDIEADVKDKYGHTPLSIAAGRGHEAVVKLLVKRGDVTADSKDMFVRTPLANAAASGHEAVVKLLVERDDVEVESKDWQGRTPLSGAAATGKEAVVKLLVERDDVEADLKDNAGRTPLSCAAAEGKGAAVKLLVERDDVEADSKDNAGRTPLSWAAAGGNEAVVKLLVERDDVEADLKDNTGRTPLSWAAAEGHEAVVKLLIERDDVEADSKDSDDRTPLWWAAAEGEFLVEKLLKERDDVKTDLKDKYGRTPLGWAEMGYRKPVF